MHEVIYSFVMDYKESLAIVITMFRADGDVITIAIWRLWGCIVGYFRWKALLQSALISLVCMNFADIMILIFYCSVCHAFKENNISLYLPCQIH